MGELYEMLKARRMGGGSGESYTKAETDALLGTKADIVDGTIPTTQIPAEVFERMEVVADDTARFALTTSDVQDGDIVYVDATQVMYYVYDDTKLGVEAGYKPFAAGTAAKAIADKNGNDITTEYQTKALGSWTAGSATSHSTPAGTDTVLEALEKIDNNQRLDETNISNIQQVPSVGSSDNGKVLTATYENGEGTYAWQAAGGGGTAKYLYQLTVKWGCRTTSAPILGYDLRFCVSFVSDDENLAVTGSVDYNTFITNYIKFSTSTGYAWVVNVNSVFISDGSSGAFASIPVSTVRINWDNGHWLFRTSDGELELEKGFSDPTVTGTKTEI